MDTIVAAAASGMRSRMEALDLLANNLANAGTAGFKADRESYQQYFAPEQNSDNSGSTDFNLPVLEHQWTDFGTGSLQQTNRPLDVAIEGDGFLAATNGTQTLLTRNGNLQLGADGQLRTSEGYAIQKRGGGKWKLDGKLPLTISTAGEVVQEGQSQGFLELVGVKDQSNLQRLAGTSFQKSEAKSGQYYAVNSLISQGKLEQSNVNPAESAVKMVEVLRQFETMQRAMALGTEMNRKAIDEVAKVTN